MELAKYVACICEGSAEQAVIEILLDADKLIFGWNSLLDGEVIRCRSASAFEQCYLRKGFSEKITALRILNSRRENFKLSKAYEHKIDVINVITVPEVEMLIILSEGKYTDYKKAEMKPSEFCKSELRYSDVKSRQFVMNYFSNAERLIEAIQEYKRVSNIPKNEYALYDLLKDYDK